ncbi:MAG: glycosyltransferase family 2 protein, partial [Candidatus Atribacteria bacterium]
MILLQLIFWICLYLIFYSYLLFPVILQLLSRNRNIKTSTFLVDELPMVSILIAAYNEEKVIG